MAEMPSRLERGGRRFRRAPAQCAGSPRGSGYCATGAPTREVGTSAARGFHPLDAELGLLGVQPQPTFDRRAARHAHIVRGRSSAAQLVRADADRPSDRTVLGYGRHTQQWFQSAPAPTDDGDVLVIQIDSKGCRRPPRPSSHDAAANESAARLPVATASRSRCARRPHAQAAPQEGRQVQEREDRGQAAAHQQATPSKWHDAKRPSAASRRGRSARCRCRRSSPAGPPAPWAIAAASTPAGTSTASARAAASESTCHLDGSMRVARARIGGREALADSLGEREGLRPDPPARNVRA
jgi:hypothetical protein